MPDDLKIPPLTAGCGVSALAPFVFGVMSGGEGVVGAAGLFCVSRRDAMGFRGSSDACESGNSEGGSFSMACMGILRLLRGAGTPMDFIGAD